MANVKTFDGLAILAQGDFVLVLWSAPARVQRGRWLYDQIEKAMAASPGGVLMLQALVQGLAALFRALGVPRDGVSQHTSAP